MNKLCIVGNPNSGKTTLFNSLTKSNEHTGNWHGVTVDKKSKYIKFNKFECELIDLPGIYSLNAFSLEEQVTIDEIKSSDSNQILYLLDANNFKRSMLLAIDLLLQNKNIKILINNYRNFSKLGGEIDTEYLKKVLGCEVEIIDAQKVKTNEIFFKFKTTETAFIKTLKNEIDYISNKVLDEDKEKLEQEIKFKKIEILYKYILKISNNCIKKQDKIYGYGKFDKKLLKTGVFLPVFTVFIFFTIYFTFFLVGPIISDLFIKLLCFTIQKPVMAIIKLSTDSKFVIALFDEGVFGACFSVLAFLPQICLMYMFLSIFENSGLITRMAFLLDDFLEKVGLNGKIVYTLLMGFGCSTTATISAKNMPDKNSKIKASLLTPFVSCSAKLPIYTTVAGALFGVKSIWIILGLYLLGVVIALIWSKVLDRNILKQNNNQFLIEFPPLKFPNLVAVWRSIKSSCQNFIVKVFGVIFGASIVIWILCNINIKFQYVGDSTKSILYSFSSIISWVFKPIGLNNPNIVCALLIGLVAKELILSTFAISNKVSNLSMLSASLVAVTSAVNFNVASGISFLVFTLLYFPCISNMSVLLKEIGVKYTLLGSTAQLLIAYVVSFILYTLFTKGVVYLLVCALVICLIAFSINKIFKKIKSKKIFCNCLMCDKCKKL